MAWTECKRKHTDDQGNTDTIGRYADCDEVSFDGGNTWVHACRDHDFTVEIGRGEKGAYRDVRHCETLAQAFLWYNGINIGNGYKKRLRIDGKTVARYADVGW